MSFLVIISMLSLAVFMCFRSNVLKTCSGSRQVLPASVFVVNSLVVAADMYAGGCVIRRLPLDMAVSILPLLVYASSTWSRRHVRKAVLTVMTLQILLVVYYLLMAYEVLPELEGSMALAAMLVVILASFIIIIFPLWMRLRDVHDVMKSGTSYHMVGQSVDFVYVFAAVVVMAFYIAAEVLFPDSLLPSYIAAILLWLEALAIGARIAGDTSFVFWRRHERILLESLKISHADTFYEENTEVEIFKDVYERILAYFEAEKPYLNGDLTINDVVHAVYTNKLYISKAISLYTGRNFCQFVNYYRIRYSVKLFRDNPELKIVELAAACGFNSVVSFNMAFRLFMNENPGEWCRKERISRIRRSKMWFH